MTNDPKSDIIAEAIMVGQQTSGRTPWTMAEVVLAALKEKYEITPYRDGEPTFDKDKNFTGWTKRRCGEHRTVGGTERCVVPAVSGATPREIWPATGAG